MVISTREISSFNLSNECHSFSITIDVDSKGSGKAGLLSLNIDEKAQSSAWVLKAKDVYLNSSHTNEIGIQLAKSLKINDKGAAKILLRGNPMQVDTLKISAKTRMSYA